ncbi:hypothetical protein LINGRAPRIM_LOCUS451 [Linum grandiflorum]
MIARRTGVSTTMTTGVCTTMTTGMCTTTTMSITIVIGVLSFQWRSH